MSSRDRPARVALGLVALGLAIAVATPGSVRAFIAGDGKGNAALDCLIGLDGGDLTPFKRTRAVQCTDCDPTCDRDGVAAPNQECTFEVAVCLNAPDLPECQPRELKKVKVGPKKLGLPTPVPAGIDPVCSVLGQVVVGTKRKGRKPGKRKVKLLAKPVGRGKDKDAILFVCNPRPAGSACLPASTTTTTLGNGSTTTTSTLPGPACRSRAITFRVESSVGVVGSAAQWPGGTEARTFEPGCEVTVARPTGPIDGGGDAFAVVGFGGYSSCFGAGGDDDDGCAVASCPAAGTGMCVAGRPQCSAPADGSGQATFRVRCNGSAWSPISYVENLLAKEKSGEWTRAEGLMQTLRLFAGEVGREAVLAGAAPLRSETTGILAMAREYLDDGADPEAQAEIARLLDDLVWTPEQLDAMAGTAATASEARIVARAVQEDCAAFFKDATVPPGVGTCLQKEAFTVNGKGYLIYSPDPSLPQAGWTEDHYAWAKQAITDSVTKYDLLGTSPSFQAPQAILVFSVRSKPDAAAEAVCWVDPCLVTIYTGAQADSEETFKQLVAHEVAHCLQGEVFTAQNAVEYEVKKWRDEGLADYWSNWVYPDANREWGALAALQARELATTLLERDYDNFIFFQYLANRIDNFGIIQLVQSLPTAGGTAAQAAKLAEYPDIAALYHDFVRAVSDENIRDTNNRIVPYRIEPPDNVSIFTITGPRVIEEDMDAFGMVRYLLQIDPDQQADMTSFEQGSVLASARPRRGSEWGEVPVSLPDRCFDSAVVASAIKPDGRFDLDIGELMDVPGQCRLEGEWLVDNESLDVMQTTFVTDYVVGEIRGTFHEDGTVEVVYDDWEFRVSDFDDLNVGGVDLVRYEEFTHTTNATGVTTYEVDGDTLRFHDFFSSGFLEGTETVHHIRTYTPSGYIGDTDEMLLWDARGWDVFAGFPHFGIVDGTLRLETFQGEIVLHRVGEPTP